MNSNDHGVISLLHCYVKQPVIAEQTSSDAARELDAFLALVPPPPAPYELPSYEEMLT